MNTPENLTAKSVTPPRGRWQSPTGAPRYKRPQKEAGDFVFQPFMASGASWLAVKLWEVEQHHKIKHMEVYGGLSIILSSFDWMMYSMHPFQERHVRTYKQTL